MKIKIDEMKAEKILCDAQKKARVRVTSFKMLCEHIEYIEKLLSKILYKKDWVGLNFEINANATDFTVRYIQPQATICIVKYTNKGWVLEHAKRGTCKGAAQKIKCLNIDTKEKKLSNFLCSYKAWSSFK